MNTGVGKTTFKIQLDADWYNKEDILSIGPYYTKVKIIKVYRLTWWKKLLLKLGFSITFFKGVKVENINV